MLAGCSQPDYVSEEVRDVSDSIAVANGKDELQGNEQDFLFQNYDVKDIETPADESLPDYDFSGPDNGGITYEPTGYVEDPVSAQDSVDANAPKIYLCPGHNKKANLTSFIASSEDDEKKVKEYLKKLNTKYEEVSKRSDDERLLEDKNNNKKGKYEKYGDALKDFMSARDSDLSAAAKNKRKYFINKKMLVFAYTNGTLAGGLKEYDECFKIANLLKTELEGYRCSVVLCKSKLGENIQDKKRAVEAGKEGCSLIIELHECGDVGKCRVFYANAGVDSKAKKLADKINAALKENYTCKGTKSLRDASGKATKGYPLVGWADMPVVRVDFGKLEAGYGQHNEKFAKAVAKGVAEAYGLESGT